MCMSLKSVPYIFYKIWAFVARKVLHYIQITSITSTLNKNDVKLANASNLRINSFLVDLLLYFHLK